MNSDVYESEFYINGYKTLCRHRDRHGGGIVIYVKENLTYIRRLDLEITQVECLCVEITFKKRRKLLICSVYRPPSANSEYFECMLDLFEKSCSEDKMVVIIGDININYTQDVRSNVSLNLIENLNGLTQLIHNYTRVTDRSSTIIDHIYTTSRDDHTSSGVFHITMSDHYLIHTVIKNCTPKLNKQEHNEIRYRCFKNFDENALITDITNSTVFDDIKNLSDVEHAWKLFKDEFLRICNKHAPVRVSRLRKRYNPWINHNIVKLMYRRNHFHKVACRTGDVDKMNQYKFYRRMVNEMIKESKKNYYQKLYTKSKPSSKMLWKELSKLSGNSTTTDRFDSSLTADELNEFFTTIGEKTVSHLPLKNEVLWKGLDSIYDFKFNQIVSETIRKCLLTLSQNSSLDVLDFDSRLLRLSAFYIAESLTTIFNLSINTSIVPSDWKYARVTPMYKGKGDISNPSNFRPISVIGHISKIFEKEIQVQLITYLISKDFITLDQSAYRKFHSTTTCLHNTIDEWLQNMDDKLLTGICFLDISKCFDTIDHFILIDKLRRYGIRNIELEWFKSYITNRFQSVKHKNVLSKPLHVNMGVPQGSTLGPLLFTLFVNDFPMHINNGTCSMFADDTVVYCSDSNVTKLNDSVNDMLHNVNEWYKSNRLALNVNKSSAMIITPTVSKINSNMFQPVLDGDIISTVNSTKYLGIYIDDNLKFNLHVNELTKNLNRKLAWLSRLRKIVPLNVLNLCYNTYIMPLFDYTCTVWGCTPSNIKSIQRLQNRAARIMCGDFDIINTRGIDLVKQLGWQTIEERINYFLGVLMYNCIYGNAPINLCNSIVMACEANDRTTRINNTMQVLVPLSRTKKYKQSFIFRGSSVWNNLPETFHNAVSVTSFKTMVKRYCRTNTAI